MPCLSGLLSFGVESFSTAHYDPNNTLHLACRSAPLQVDRLTSCSLLWSDVFPRYFKKPRISFEEER